LLQGTVYVIEETSFSHIKLLIAITQLKDKVIQAESSMIQNPEKFYSSVEIFPSLVLFVCLFIRSLVFSLKCQSKEKEISKLNI